MKTNKALHDSIGFTDVGSKAWYVAHTLMAALTASPAISIEPARAAALGKRFVPGYAGYAESFPVAAGVNTQGAVAGEVFPGRPAVAAIPASNGYAAVLPIPELVPSPAYPAGTAIPVYPFVATRLEQVLTQPVTARAEIKTPVVTPLPGWGNAIQIAIGSTELTITAKLPVYAGVGLAGSNKLVIGEITPTALQATAFVQPKVRADGQSFECQDNLLDLTLEKCFYRLAQQCQHIETEIVENIAGTMINCRQLVITLYPKSGFDPFSNDLQLALVSIYPEGTGDGYGYAN